MARNKHPEETVNRILDVSLKLFLEQGYDSTTIQDIVDHLEVTKGAVYHHFKSKEDILSAALDRSNVALVAQLRAICSDPHVSGLEKLQALFEVSVKGPQLPMSAAMLISPDPVKNARLLGLQFKSVLEETVPLFVEPIIRQGAEDGSIRTEHPREMAEVIVILANLWVNPMFNLTSVEQMQGRINYYLDLVHLLGADIQDAGCSDVLINYLKDYETLQNSQDETLRNPRDERARSPRGAIIRSPRGEALRSLQGESLRNGQDANIRNPQDEPLRNPQGEILRNAQNENHRDPQEGVGK